MTVIFELHLKSFVQAPLNLYTNLYTNSLCLLPKPDLSSTIPGSLGSESSSRVRLCDAMDYTVYGILQARTPECVAIPFSRGSSRPRDWTQVSRIAGDSLPAEPQGKPKGNLVTRET